MIEYCPRGRPFEGYCNGIPFNTDLINADGCSVEFFPKKGVHDRSDVAKAKRELKNNRDVVVFYVSWVEDFAWHGDGI